MVERVRRASGAASVVLDERLALLWGRYGELWRARLTRGSDTKTVIVKHVQPPPGDQSLSHRRKLRSYAVEQAFYERYAARCLAAPGCRIPRPLQLRFEHDSWLFLLEDLDASGFAARATHATPEQIVATLRWLANFHARFLGTAPEQLWKTGTYWHLATRPDELRAMRHAALREAAPRLDHRLAAARFKTLVHGDAKLENVCFSATIPEVALVDFQYVGGGVGVKDVAYFLSSCLPPGEQAALVPRYLDDYFRELAQAVAANEPSLDRAALEREWRELFPLAWLDFYRFLLGWAPGQFDGEPYGEQLLSKLKSE